MIIRFLHLTMSSSETRTMSYSSWNSLLRGHSNVSQKERDIGGKNTEVSIELRIGLFSLLRWSCMPFFFLNYILLFMLLQLPQVFPFHPPPPNSTCSLWQSSHCSACPSILHICSLATIVLILCFLPLWLFCNYQFVLLDFFHPSRQPPSQLATIKTFSVFTVLFLFCLFILSFRLHCYEYIFIAFLLFIFLLFFFSFKKTL